MSVIRKAISVFFTVFVLITFSSTVYAETDISLGLERMSGETWYQIGGTVTRQFPFGIEIEEKVHFPISELRFPLDVYLLSLGGRVNLMKFILSAKLSKNITSDAGDMEDSDWGAYFLETGHPKYSKRSLDYFSLSEADLDALKLDLGLRYKFFSIPTFSLSAGVGLRYQNFDYELSNLDQWYPSSRKYFGYDFAHDRVSGLVGTYEVTYSVPFAEVAGNLHLGKKASLEARLGYSPFVSAEDRDDHKLRFILAETDAEGTALLFALKGQYQFLKRWFASLELDYMNIEADGTERNIIYAGENRGAAWTIDHQIESQQAAVSIAVGYSF